MAPRQIASSATPVERVDADVQARLVPVRQFSSDEELKRSLARVEGVLEALRQMPAGAPSAGEDADVQASVAMFSDEDSKQAISSADRHRRGAEGDLDAAAGLMADDEATAKLRALRRVTWEWREDAPADARDQPDGS